MPAHSKHACVGACMRACVRACVCMCMHVYACVCICGWVHVCQELYCGELNHVELTLIDNQNWSGCVHVIAAAHAGIMLTPAPQLMSVVRQVKATGVTGPGLLLRLSCCCCCCHCWVIVQVAAATKAATDPCAIFSAVLLVTCSAAAGSRGGKGVDCQRWQR